MSAGLATPARMAAALFVAVVSVTASVAGMAVAERRGVIGKATTIKLEAGAVRVVQVRSANDEPIADVIVAMGSRPHPFGFTDEAGKIEVHLDPSAPTEVHLLAPDGRGFSKRVEPRKPAGGEQKDKQE